MIPTRKHYHYQRYWWWYSKITQGSSVTNIFSFIFGRKNIWNLVKYRQLQFCMTCHGPYVFYCHTSTNIIIHLIFFLPSDNYIAELKWTTVHIGLKNIIEWLVPHSISHKNCVLTIDCYYNICIKHENLEIQQTLLTKTYT